MNEKLAVLFRRFEAIGKAQSRYLYLLLVATAYFLALDYRIEKDAGFANNLMGIPSIELGVYPRAIWILSPMALAVIIMALLGAIIASNAIHDAIREEDELSRVRYEFIDSVPNLIDFAVYTTRLTPRIGQVLALGSYPFFVTLATVAMVRLTARVGRSSFGTPVRSVVVTVVALLSIPILWRLVRMWRFKLRQAREAWNDPAI